MQGSINFGNESIRFTFIEKPRLRNSYMKFKGEELQIISSNPNSVKKIVEKHKPWIIKHYSQIKSSIKLFDKNSILFSGKKYIVLFREENYQSNVSVNNDVIIICAKNKESANLLLEKWIRSQTMKIVESKTLEKVKLLDVEVKKISLRKSKKWGTCTNKKVITYNPYISMLPDYIVEYIVSHEVSHLKELNHSKSFWNIVSNIFPSYKISKKELLKYDSSNRIILS